MTALLLLASLALAADPTCRDGDDDACVAESRSIREHLELSCNAGSAQGCYHLALNVAHDTPYSDPYLSNLAQREACGHGSKLSICTALPTLKLDPTWSADAWEPPSSEDASLEGTLRIEVAGDVSFDKVRSALGAAAEAGFLRIQLIVDGDPLNVVVPSLDDSGPDPAAAGRGTKGSIHGLKQLPKGSDPRGYGTPIILGALDKSLIDETIKERKTMNRIRYCYQRQLSKEPDLAGKVVVRFVIGKDGRVVKASIKSSTMGQERVEACITGVFMDLEFPEPRGGGIVIVSYPFIFAPG